jgi:cytidine deaminase
VSDSPFPTDPARAAAHEARAGDAPAIRAAALDGLGAESGHVVPAERAAEVVERFDLLDVDALMLLLLDDARTLADPPMSGYWVGIVGRESDTGDLVLGGNLEFPGTHLGTTVHGEGFVMTRAYQRGTSIATLALNRAHPCAHCRQYISEFAASADLTLIDTLGHRLSLADIYPWPFAPSALGEVGAVPGIDHHPDLAIADARRAEQALPDGARTALLAAGRRAWTPYSGCPSAAVVQVADGSLWSGAAVESVAFNPTMPPLQSALIAARAHGHAWADIRAAWLGTTVGGDVDMTRSAADLLAVIAPDSPLTVVDWRP